MNGVDLSILWPALAAGLLVTATHVPLGMQVLARGIVFIDLAIAQIAGCGVILADRIGFDAGGASAQIAALIAALAGALLLTWTERRWPEVQEAVIGVVFVMAATAGVLLLASNVHGSEHLRDLLVGQILWGAPRQLLVTACAYAVVLALWFGARPRLGRTGFYLLFACVVTLSVQLVGLYLVFATLIVPPLATRVGDRHRRLCQRHCGVGGVRHSHRSADRVDAGGVRRCAFRAVVAQQAGHRRGGRMTPPRNGKIARTRASRALGNRPHRRLRCADDLALDLDEPAELERQCRDGLRILGCRKIGPAHGLAAGARRHVGTSDACDDFAFADAGNEELALGGVTLALGAFARLALACGLRRGRARGDEMRVGTGRDAKRNDRDRGRIAIEIAQLLPGRTRIFLVGDRSIVERTLVHARSSAGSEQRGCNCERRTPECRLQMHCAGTPFHDALR